MKRILRNLVFALIIGLGLLGLVAIVTFGVPFTFNCPVTTCRLPGGHNYDRLFMGVDYLFWVSVAFLLVSVADKISGRWGNEPKYIRYDERGKLKFFVALILFGLAIYSLWLGLTSSGIEILVWITGALVLGIAGITVFKLPPTTEGKDGK